MYQEGAQKEHRDNWDNSEQVLTPLPGMGILLSLPAQKENKGREKKRDPTAAGRIRMREKEVPN